MHYTELSINEIKLDLNNPRIRGWIEQFGDNISSEQIALALQGGDNNNTGYRSLYDSIVSNCGIITPIIVNRDANGEFTVIEGNTRVQIYKELFEKTHEDRWSRIIAIVNNELDDTQMHAIRLQSHLVGAREWTPFAKAKYLYDLSETQQMAVSEIIATCGGHGNATKIKDSISAYKDYIFNYCDSCNKLEIEPDPQDFSKFVEGQKTQIVNALLTHGYTKKDFADWVAKGNIDKALSVRIIPKVLANKKAKETFLRTNLTQAEAYITIPSDEALSDMKKVSTYDLANEVVDRIGKIEFREFDALKNDVEWSDKRLIIERLHEEISHLVDMLQD